MDYYRICVRDCTARSGDLGIGVGADPNGSLRVCISLGGKTINADIRGRELRRLNWSSLTMPVARRLTAALLAIFERHGGVPGWTIRRTRRGRTKDSR